MKFYATVTTQGVIELNADNLEQAIEAADQQVAARLPASEGWKSQIDVSAVHGFALPRYYVRLVASSMYEVRSRQLAYQPKQANNQTGLDASDPIIKFFTSTEEAHNYAADLNAIQTKLDRQYGRWAKDAVTADNASQ